MKNKWEDFDRADLEPDDIKRLLDLDKKDELSKKEELVSCGECNFDRDMIPNIVGNFVHDTIGSTAGGFQSALALGVSLVAFEYAARKQPLILKKIENKVGGWCSRLAWLEKKVGLFEEESKIDGFEIPTS